MARNGTDFGIQVSGTGDEWFTGPAQIADGLYLGAYGPDDANPDIGDSAITETAGIGGFAMATAPAIVRFVGGIGAGRACHHRSGCTTSAWREPGLGDPDPGVPGTPTGIDVTGAPHGILPQINTGMAGRWPAPARSEPDSSRRRWMLHRRDRGPRESHATAYVDRARYASRSVRSAGRCRRSRAGGLGAVRRLDRHRRQRSCRRRDPEPPRVGRGAADP